LLGKVCAFSLKGDVKQAWNIFNPGISTAYLRHLVDCGFIKKWHRSGMTTQFEQIKFSARSALYRATRIQVIKNLKKTNNKSAHSDDAAFSENNAHLRQCSCSYNHGFFGTVYIHPEPSGKTARRKNNAKKKKTPNFCCFLKKQKLRQ
jgi:hypothetical protein